MAMPGNAIIVTLLSFAALGLAYRFYGRFLARRVFPLRDDHATPARRYEDGVDFVPTPLPVLFGHHFATIAGLGPILGPAIAVIWGWLPAVLWVVIGSIFIGAVHDFGALTVSLRFSNERNKAPSIGDVTRALIGPRARLLFLLIIFFILALAMGAFVLAIARLFIEFNPDAIVPSLGLMLVAVLMGVSLYKWRLPLMPCTVVAVGLMFLLIHLGVRNPLPSYAWFADGPTKAALSVAANDPAYRELAPYGSDQVVAYFSAKGDENTVAGLRGAVEAARRFWIYGLLGYALVASILPVWILLQPRDYINSFQLYVGLVLLAVGLAVANPPIAAPVVNRAPTDLPPMFPILFITIACGAISGFHSLVSSGTTVRQLRSERDAPAIGYGAMLTEGALAVLVIMACVAGLSLVETGAWGAQGRYVSWGGMNSLAAQLNAVVVGGGAFLAALGVPLSYGKGFIAVTIVAFALTTLDSATRLLRYNVEELARTITALRRSGAAAPEVASATGVGFGTWTKRMLAGLVAVAAIGFFATMKFPQTSAAGEVVYAPAGLILWQLFGTGNQLLAGLTLLTVSLFLFNLRRPAWYTAVPMVFMLITTLCAMVWSLQKFAREHAWPLIVVGSIVLAMTVWLLVEAVVAFRRGRRELEGIEVRGEEPEPVGAGVGAARE